MSQAVIVHLSHHSFEVSDTIFGHKFLFAQNTNTTRTPFTRTIVTYTLLSRTHARSKGHHITTHTQLPHTRAPLIHTHTHTHTHIHTPDWHISCYVAKEIRTNLMPMLKLNDDVLVRHTPTSVCIKNILTITTSMNAPETLHFIRHAIASKHMSTPSAHMYMDTCTT